MTLKFYNFKLNEYEPDTLNWVKLGLGWFYSNPNKFTKVTNKRNCYRSRMGLPVILQEAHYINLYFCAGNHLFLLEVEFSPRVLQELQNAEGHTTI